MQKTIVQISNFQLSWVAQLLGYMYTSIRSFKGDNQEARVFISRSGLKFQLKIVTTFLRKTHGGCDSLDRGQASISLSQCTCLL